MGLVASLPLLSVICLCVAYEKGEDTVKKYEASNEEQRRTILSNLLDRVERIERTFNSHLLSGIHLKLPISHVQSSSVGGSLDAMLSTMIVRIVFIAYMILSTLLFVFSCSISSVQLECKVVVQYLY